MTTFTINTPDTSGLWIAVLILGIITVFSLILVLAADEEEFLIIPVMFFFATLFVLFLSVFAGLGGESETTALSHHGYHNVAWSSTSTDVFYAEHNGKTAEYVLLEPTGDSDTYKVLPYTAGK